MPGATRIVYGGGGHFLTGENAEHIELTGLVLDGANQFIADYAQALLELRGVRHLVVDNCQIAGSGKNAVALERVAGRIERTAISGAADVGIWSVEGDGVSITNNSVSDCGNGGILVHRWKPAEDGTIVSGNRIDMVATGPMPGSTPTRLPTSTPRKQYIRLCGSSATPKPYQRSCSAVPIMG